MHVPQTSAEEKLRPSVVDAALPLRCSALRFYNWKLLAAAQSQAVLISVLIQC